ncbi:hypothetical protein [Streptomyces rimosus]|uniref:hypothetical protein n=1 Tax=Streptomyces rimosus TaxID=1927 RepID=UPI00067BAE8E|nr:hypothetical protein [Streptomyces rimosus]
MPHGVAVLPGDSGVRRIAEGEHKVVHWSEFDRGGHFPAMEVPDLLVDDVRAFFRLVQAGLASVASNAVLHGRTARRNPPPPAEISPASALGGNL